MKQIDSISVRPKSSHRKQRSPGQRTRLEPAQARSRRRNDQILDAVADLLQTANIEDLSHSDVAQMAGVSKASVHYHFPTIAAMQLELGRRYDEEVSLLLIQWAREAEPQARTWQDIVRIGAGRARVWFNAHRPACEALLGPTLTRENRLASIRYNSQAGTSMANAIQRVFLMPYHPNLDEVFSYNGDIIDLFWSRSYLATGTISEAAHEEALRASLGYLRNFLPEFLPRTPAASSNAA